MMAISTTLEICQSGVTATASYIKSHSRALIVGAIALGAIYAASLISSNLEEEVTVRYGGGRTLADSMAEPVMRQIDPTPFLRRLSTMISQR